MRLVFLLCAAFALGAATGPGEELKEAPQPEERPDESAALVMGMFEKVETVPVVEEEEEGRMPGDFGRSKSGCPSSWSQFESRCFIFIPREMPWIDAEKHCVRNGANLASIHTAQEYRYIQDMVRVATGVFRHTWIGGTDAIKDGTWFWSDGSGFHFHLWGLGEPNNLDGNERCLKMNYHADLLWNDLPCEVQLPFVCGTRP